jgi:hypothetical protein
MADLETSHQATLQRIAEQEARIARQKVLIAKLAANGWGSGDARRVLATMEDGLTALRTSFQSTGAPDDASQ